MQNLIRSSRGLHRQKELEGCVGEPALLVTAAPITGAPNWTRQTRVEMRAGVVGAPPLQVAGGMRIPIKRGKLVMVGIGLRGHLHGIVPAERDWEIINPDHRTALHIGQESFFSWFGWERFVHEHGALGLDWSLPLRLMKAIGYKPEVPAREPHKVRAEPWGEMFIKLYHDYHRFPPNHPAHHNFKELLVWLGEELESSEVRALV